MYLKSQERRKALGDQSIDSHTMNRYRHASRHGTKHCSIKNVKCCERSLPFARYCTKRMFVAAERVLYFCTGVITLSHYYEMLIQQLQGDTDISWSDFLLCLNLCSLNLYQIQSWTLSRCCSGVVAVWRSMVDQPVNALWLIITTMYDVGTITTMPTSWLPNPLPRLIKV